MPLYGYKDTRMENPSPLLWSKLSWGCLLSCTSLRLNVDYYVETRKSGKVLRYDNINILSCKVAES